MSYGSDTYTVEDRTMPAVVYALYIIGLFHGLTLIVGLIMAFVLRGNAGPANHSHYTYLIRTFWIGLVGMAVGGAIALVGVPLSFVLIGIPLVWLGGSLCFIAWLWAIIRSIVGVIRLANGEPIAQPYGLTV